MQPLRSASFVATGTTAILLALLSLGCTSSSPTAARSTTTPLAIPSDQLVGDEEVLPAAIVAAVTAALPGGRLIGASREEEADGEVSYEVLVETEEGVLAVDLSAAGVVREIEPEDDEERPISASDLPRAVRDAVDVTVPGGRITAAVRLSRRGEVIFDIEVDVRGRKFDLEIAADGTVLDVEEGN